MAQGTHLRHEDFYLCVKFVSQQKRGPIKAKGVKVPRSMLLYEIP